VPGDSPKDASVTPQEIAAFVDALADAVAKGDEEAMRFAAAMAAQRSQNGAAGARAYWQRLADGFYSDEATVREAAAASGVALAPSYAAVVLELEEPTPPQIADLRRLAIEVFASQAPLGVLESAAGLELLVPVTREVDASNARTAATLLPKSVAKRKLALRINGGTAAAAPAVAAPRTLHSARTALAIGRRIFGTGRVHVYEDLGAYRLLHGGASAELLREFSNATLAPLREYDRKHQTELERTLHLYFACGQNVKTAATLLSVHRHTVFYRLRQIAEICRADLGTPHDQLTLRLAMAIDALHS
jgi:sugar diacid utilization regulator